MVEVVAQTHIQTYLLAVSWTWGCALPSGKFWAHSFQAEVRLCSLCKYLGIYFWFLQQSGGFSITRKAVMKHLRPLNKVIHLYTTLALCMCLYCAILIVTLMAAISAQGPYTTLTQTIDVISRWRMSLIETHWVGRRQGRWGRNDWGLQSPRGLILTNGSPPLPSNHHLKMSNH